MHQCEGWGKSNQRSGFGKIAKPLYTFIRGNLNKTCAGYRCKKNCRTLKDNASATLGNAQLTLSTDKKALSDAEAGLIKEGQIRCDQETTSCVL